MNGSRAGSDKIDPHWRRAFVL